MTAVLDRTPTSPVPAVTSRRRVGTPVVFAALAVLYATIAWLRLPGLTRGTLWAEDGRDFLQGAIDHGLGVLFEPYGGYLHVVPRLLAGATVAVFPAEHYAVAMTAASCVVAGLCGAIVWAVSRQRLHGGWAALLGAVTVLAPFAAREVLGNVANLHTLLMWTVFWILLFIPRRRTTAWVLAVVVLLFALTEVQTLFLAPLLLWRWRTRLRWPIMGAFVVGVGAQLAASVLEPRKQTGTGDTDLWSYPFGYLINAVMPLGLPQSAIGAVVAASGALVGTVFVVIIAATLFALLRRTDRDTWFVVIAALALSGVVYVGGVALTPDPRYDYATFTRNALADPWFVRYGVLPSMLILAAVIVAAGSRASRLTAPRLRAIVVVAIITTMAVHFVPQDTRRSNGPAWAPQVTAARIACAHGASEVTLDQTLDWHVTLPCTLLR